MYRPRIPRRLRWAHATLSLALGLALAQSSRAEVTDSERFRQVRGALSETPAPSAAGPVAPLNAFSVEGSQDAANATLKFGGVSNRIFVDPATARSRGDFTTFSAAISTPLDKKRGFTGQAGLDGLTKSTNVTFQINFLTVPGVGDWGDGGENGKPCNAMRQGYYAKNPGTKIPPPPCDGQAIYQYTGDMAQVKAYEDGADSAVANRADLGLFGVFGKVGYEELTYYDPTTLAKDALKRTPWQIGAYLGRIDGGGNWSWAVQALHEVSYKEKDGATACLAGTGPVLTCISGPLGRAEQVTKDVLSLEGRLTAFKVNLGFGETKLGFGPKIAYDANNDDLALSFPVYLFSGKDGLTGGIRADWESNEHDIVVGLFVTKSFSTLTPVGNN
jgi:hypothetical protein